MAEPKPLFARVLDDAYYQLPPQVQDMHDVHAVLRAAGRCSVVRGEAWVSRLIATATGMPRSGPDVPVSVEMCRAGAQEVWQRNFGDVRLTTRFNQDSRATMIRERLGPLTMIMRLEADRSGLSMHGVETALFTVPIPRLLGLGIRGRETVEDGRFTFDVSVFLPFGLPLIHYRGWLRLIASPAPHHEHGRAAS